MNLKELKGAAAVTEIRPSEYSCIFNRARVGKMIEVIEAAIAAKDCWHDPEKKVSELSFRDFQDRLRELEAM